VARRQVRGLVITAALFFNARHAPLAALARRHRVPRTWPHGEVVEAAGLMSYGGGILEGSRAAGVYVGRILKGARPADLPVLQVTTIELVMNLKTAEALGLALPAAL